METNMEMLQYYLFSPRMVATHLIQAGLLSCLYRRGAALGAVAGLGVLEEVVTFLVWLAVYNSWSSILSIWLYIFVYECIVDQSSEADRKNTSVAGATTRNSDFVTRDSTDFCEDVKPSDILYKTSAVSLNSHQAIPDVQERVTLKNWDPTKLLEELYRIKLQQVEDEAVTAASMEGCMQHLPISKGKATRLRAWKNRYFKAKDGNLIYYDIDNHSKSKILPLDGATVDDLDELMLGVDDKEGRYLVLKCASKEDFIDWKRALQSQVAHSITTNYVMPVLKAPQHQTKNVIILDIGSSAVRAGILGTCPTLPQVFFPSVVALDRRTGQMKFGFEAFASDVRSNLNYIVRPTGKTEKSSLDIEVIPKLLQKIFKDLNVDPSEYWILLSSSVNFGDKMKEDLMDILINEFNTLGAQIVNQSLMALYAYGARSGMVVNVGNTLEIVPVTDGYIVVNGLDRQPFGGHKVIEVFNSYLSDRRYTLPPTVDFLVVQLAMQKLCFVSKDFEEDQKSHQSGQIHYKKTVDLTPYDFPKGSWKDVSCDTARFESPEGLFDTRLWGMDNLSLPKLIYNAVQACPMDTRRLMWRSIFLSGGLSMLPGFAERLQTELTKIVAPSIVVQVHAAAQRYHAAYVGACTLANMPEFESAAISAQEWHQNGASSLRKRHMI